MINRTLVLTFFVMTSACPAVAGNLRYSPLNPAFGGNPNLSGFLLSTAQIQNKFVDSGGGGGDAGVPDISFPPIVIDLGGLDGDNPDSDDGTDSDPVDGTSDPVTPDVASQIDSSSTSNILRMP
jgi:hypothetical protein